MLFSSEALSFDFVTRFLSHRHKADGACLTWRQGQTWRWRVCHLAAAPPPPGRRASDPLAPAAHRSFPPPGPARSFLGQARASPALQAFPDRPLLLALPRGVRGQLGPGRDPTLLGGTAVPSASAPPPPGLAPRAALCILRARPRLRGAPCSPRHISSGSLTSSSAPFSLFLSHPHLPWAAPVISLWVHSSVGTQVPSDRVAMIIRLEMGFPRPWPLVPSCTLDPSAPRGGKLPPPASASLAVIPTCLLSWGQGACAPCRM